MVRCKSLRYTTVHGAGFHESPQTDCQMTANTILKNAHNRSLVPGPAAPGPRSTARRPRKSVTKRSQAKFCRRAGIRRSCGLEGSPRGRKPCLVQTLTHKMTQM
jgi:hypothetical protein